MIFIINICNSIRVIYMHKDNVRICMSVTHTYYTNTYMYLYMHMYRYIMPPSDKHDETLLGRGECVVRIITLFYV